jgi:hypothetical protein
VSHRHRQVTVRLRDRDCIVAVEEEQSNDPADGGPSWYFVDTGEEEIHHLTDDEDMLIINTIVETRDD